MKWISVSILALFLLQFSLPAQDGMGFGSTDISQDFPCLSDEQRRNIKARLQTKIDSLLSIDKIQPGTQQTQPLLEWPVVPAPGVTDPDIYAISFYVDQEPTFPGQLLDFFCGNRTYDLTNGYNHSGIDMFNWPFRWYKMDNDLVHVVAAAPGTIIFKQDGNFDRNCSFGNGSWNAVYLRHRDGSVTWYAHLKNGSLTEKAVGDVVTAGEFLGVVGSSGNSSGPHLHFETYDAGDNLIDPFAGSCNTLNSESWWLEQRPYYNSGINKLMTHSAPPVFPPCPQQEILNEKNHFIQGEVVYTAAYYRDQLNGQNSEYKVLQPDGSVYIQWPHSSDADHFNSSYWYWWWNLPENASTGIWTFQVTYESEIYEHQFSVGPTNIEPATAAIPRDFELQQNFPNPFNPTTTIEYAVKSTSSISIKIYNSLGQQVSVLLNSVSTPGSYSLQWDGRDDSGNLLPGGVYYYRMTGGDFAKTRAMTLLK